MHSVSTDQGNCNMESHNSEDVSTCLSMCMCVSVCVCLCLCMTICLCAHMSICLSVHYNPRKESLVGREGLSYCAIL